MNYIITAVIAIITVAGGFFVQDKVSPSVGASQSISSLTELTSLSHDDVLPITDTANATTKKVKWGTATSTLKTLFDPIYSPIAGSASLVTLGNVTTGTWNADTLSVAKGGTGSTSLIAYQLLAGNGTGAVTTFGNGTSGYVLTSNGAGALPSFQNVGVTTANNNTWTGTNTFNGASTFNATTTISGALYGANRYVDYLASTTINGASSPVAVFIATSTNAVWATNASNATTSDFLGFVRQNVTNGATTSVQIDGVVGGFTGLTSGQSYYASTTGVISTTIGTAEVYVGRALSSTELLLDRKGESWQYLGSSGCSGSATVNSTSCDAVGTPFARFAVVVFTTQTSSCTTGATGYYYGTVVVAKMGQGSASSAGAFGSSSASPNACPSSNNAVAWTSTSSIRYSANIGGSGTFSAQPSATAYFYR